MRAMLLILNYDTKILYYYTTLLYYTILLSYTTGLRLRRLEDLLVGSLGLGDGLVVPVMRGRAIRPALVRGV